ncbi:hypothetical protein ACLB2K_039182 [Fragaria x ananassa]
MGLKEKGKSEVTAKPVRAIGLARSVEATVADEVLIVFRRTVHSDLSLFVAPSPISNAATCFSAGLFLYFPLLDTRRVLKILSSFIEKVEMAFVFGRRKKKENNLSLLHTWRSGISLSAKLPTNPSYINSLATANPFKLYPTCLLLSLSLPPSTRSLRSLRPLYSGSKSVELKMQSNEAPSSVEVKAVANGVGSASGTLPPKPSFEPLKAHEMSDGQVQFRKVSVPPHRYTPLKKAWMEIYTPIYEQMKIDIRMNLKGRKVELKTRRDTPDISHLQKCADFVQAFMLGFDVIDAIALLRLDELYVESFEIKDVKTLRGEHLSRAIGRLSGKGGRTKFAIENATKTRIVIADTKIHILGSFANIKVARDSLCNLILGSPAAKVYSKLRAVTARLAERNFALMGLSVCKEKIDSNCKRNSGAPARTVGWRDPGFIHTSFLKELWPNRVYTYKLGHKLSNGTYIWSQEYQFKASPYPGQNSLQHVVIFGDMGKDEADGSNEYNNFQRGALNTTKQLIQDLKNIDIVFHIGDISYANGYLSQWDQFTAQVEPIASTVPYMIASGNHERDWPGSGSFYGNNDSGGECGVLAENMIYVPTMNNAKSWYSTDYGMFHFCIADTEHDWREGTEQY